MREAWRQTRLWWWDACCTVGYRLRWQWLYWRGIHGMMDLRFEVEVGDARD